MLNLKTFTPLITNTLNSYLQMDPEAKPRLEHLNQQALAIHVQPFDLALQLYFNEGEIQVLTESIVEPKATIKATPLQFINAFFDKANRQEHIANDFVILGDASFAADVMAFFDELQIDWEDFLAKAIGDVPAHFLKRFFLQGKSVIKETKESCAEQVKEYIHEEANWQPSKEALQDFFAEIDELRMHADRVEAKINVLKNKLLNTEG